MDYEKKQRLIALRDSMKSYGYIDGVEELESIFPDLEEDEDERIRKAIRYCISQAKHVGGTLIYGVTREQALSYIEKQKEQKPEEKPINWTELTWKDIVELEGIINNVHYEFRNGIGQESFGKEVLEKFREYKGDEYLDGIEQKPVEPVEYLSKDKVYAIMTKLINLSYSTRIPTNSDEYKKLDEITKDVRNLLVYPIEQKPVEWNFPYGVNEATDKLIAIAECLEMDGDCLFNGYSGTECGKFLRELARKQVECKSEGWSEKDEECRKELIQYIEQRIGDGTTGQSLWKKWHSWLCFLPLNLKKKNEDVEKLCSNEWSEEDEDNLKRAINICINDFGEESETAKFLKSLPERLNLHSKQGRSEDERKVVIDEGKDDIDNGFTMMMEKGQKHPIQIVNLNKAIVEDIRNGVPTKTIEETRGVKFATPIGKEQKPAECDKETDIQKAFREGQNAGRQEVFDNPGAYGLEKINNVFGFRIGDRVRLVDGDGRPHIIKMFERIEGLHGPDFYRVVFEDNTASDHIIPGSEYPNGYFTCIEKIDMEKKEQKPVHTAKEMWKEMRLEVYAQASGNRHEPNYSDDSTKMFSLCDIDEIFEKIGDSTVGSQPAEWSEEDERMLSRCVKSIESSKQFADSDTFKRAKDNEIDWIKNRLKFLRPKKNISYGELPLVSIDYMEGLDTYFEKQVGAVIASAMNREHQFTSKHIKWTAQRLMECARDKRNSEEEHVSDNKEWSEEDEKMLVRILDSISIGNDYEEMRNWLLPKLKSIRPQPHTVSIKDATKFGNLEYERGVKDGIQHSENHRWKPSEEQMETLKSCFHINPATGEPHSPSLDEIYMLGSLYNDLEKIVGNEQ